MLFIGLGGAALPSALRALLPAARFDIVEREPAVISAARRFFGLPPASRNTTMHQADAFDFVTHAVQSGRGRYYDLIFLDAFDSEYVPFPLRTLGYLKAVRALLSPGGVVAANLFDRSWRGMQLDRESAT